MYSINGRIKNGQVNYMEELILLTFVVLQIKTAPSPESCAHTPCIYASMSSTLHIHTHTTPKHPYLFSQPINVKPMFGRTACLL